MKTKQSAGVSNVLLLFSSSSLGGAEKSLSRMAFSSTNVKYTLSTLDSDGPWCEWVMSKGFKPLVYGDYNFISLVRKLYKDIKRLDFDVVYVCGLRASFLLRFLLIFLPKTKLIHGVRWNPNTNTLLDKSFRMVERYFSWLVDGWIVNSKIIQHTLISRCGIKNSKIHVIYNGITLPSNINSFPEGEIEVLTVANLNKRKGYLEYLIIISKIVELLPNIKFVFVGRDEMDGEVQKKITKYGLENYVSYKGFQSDVTDCFERASLFVLPSLWGEGCPTSILEAFSYSIPVVAYNIDGIPELVKSGDDGLLLELGDDNGYKKIVEILKSNEILSIMGERGRDKIKNNFTIDSCVRNHKTVINKVLGCN